MTTRFPREIHSALTSLLHEAGILSGSELPGKERNISVEPLKGDGSSRRFWRLIIPGIFRGIVVAPEKSEGQGLREAGSVWKIGSHLRAALIPVPELYGFDESTGIAVCEDLGETHLHGLAGATDFSDPQSIQRLREVYRETLDVLIAMQVGGSQGFDTDWCWDTPLYDRGLMLERESGYFLRAFWQGLLGQQVPDGLPAEFLKLADAAAEAPATFFLHRDFQSRNVMIKEGRVRIIDFQGGRLGPLGYDLASLLLDPYAALPIWFQDELYAYYLQQVQLAITIDSDLFQRSYPMLALQRNLQIIGAFSHLSVVAGKPFFQRYLDPAIASLLCQLTGGIHAEFPILTAVAERSRQLRADNASYPKE